MAHSSALMLLLVAATATLATEKKVIATEKKLNITYVPMMPAPHGKPGMQTIGDTLIAFSDLRLRRSTDGGSSFGPVINVMPDHQKAKCLRPDDGVMLADEHTKTLFFIFACDDDKNTKGRSDQLVAINSTDSGLTWSAPAVNITAGTRLGTYKGGGASVTEAYIPAIGGGIQTSSGRLVAQMYGMWCFTGKCGCCLSAFFLFSKKLRIQIRRARATTRARFGRTARAR